MVASKVRQNARESLTGKWGKGALIVLAYFLVEFVIGFIIGLFENVPFLGFILSIANIVISLPLSYGLITMFIKLKRGEDVGYFDFLSVAFSNIKRVWGVYGNIVLKVLPAVIVIIVAALVLTFSSTAAVLTSSGSLGSLSIIAFIVFLACVIYLIPKNLSYSLSYMVLFDKSELSGKEIVEESERLMNGHRCGLVWLVITFIGWMLLAACTLGIGYLWLLPYMLVAQICFYEELADSSESQTPKTGDAGNGNDIVDNGPIKEI